MRLKLVVAAAALAAVIAGYFLFFGKSDEDQIRETLARLTRVVRVTEDDGNPLFKAAKVKDELEAILTDDVHVTIPELSIRQGRQGMAETAMQAQLAFSSAEVELRALEITIEPQGGQAHVGADAILRGKARGGATRRDDRSVDFLLRKEDRRWKVRSVTVWTPK